ncbi:MAG: hypothetical protein ONB44_13650 [candidate division KSB1 bacterium]|nr:hypothetical protein [candidate division KSB1 bacterium]MDZ7303168.1 hypothetical protein [candidate division KSB1 bacterium]MDZ7310147.1 hypothetical protein [candidate division KSB1 bacterium]
MKPFLIFVFSLVTLANFSVSHAQLCFRYDQTDSCSSYPITDVMISTPFPGAAGKPERHVDLATNLGWLFVLRQRVAVGPSLFFSAYLNGGWHSQVGLHGRVRVHCTKNFRADISPGMILHDSPYPEGFAGYSTEMAAIYRDWVGVVARLDVVKSYPRGHDPVFQVGLKFGSYAGLGLTGLGAIAGGISYILNQMD